MPKIQLSALATDMKGKSGGSVFARNKGGLYFRNNPSPVQKKSYKWASQKVNFSSVSTIWKSLTDEQRAAWENMTSNYPQQDAWGNTYIPSGFQLYMKLNTTLVSNGLPAISTPLMPEEMPISDDIGLYCPDQEAFTPTTGASLKGLDNLMLYLFSKGFISNQDLTQTNHLSIRFARNPKKGKIYTPGTCVPLVSLLQTERSKEEAIIVTKIGAKPQPIRKSSFGFFSYIQFNKAGKISLFVVYNYNNEEGSPTSSVFEYDVTNEFNLGNLHLTYAVSVNTSLVQNVFINGFVGRILSSAVYNSFQDGYRLGNGFVGELIDDQITVPVRSFSAPLRVGNYNQQNTPVFIASDIRYWDAQAMGAPCGCQSGADCPDDYDCRDCDCFLVWDDKIAWSEMRYQLIAKGYILGNETSITPLNDFTKGIFETYTTSDIPAVHVIKDEDCCDPDDSCKDFVQLKCVDCVCEVDGDIGGIAVSLPVTFSPIAVVTPFNPNVEGYFLSIYSTKPIGLGRSDFNSPKILIATIPLDGSTADITGQIAKFFPSVKANSKLVLSYKMINSNTGEAIECKPKPKPPKKYSNPIRFKAGSELSSSVN